jgi:PAS domain S-box-containing protein
METRFQELIEMLPEPAYEIDSSGRLTYLNRAGLERFGITTADLHDGIWLVKEMIPEDRERGREDILRQLQGLKPLSPREYTFIDRNGRQLPYMILSNQVLRQGKIVGLQGILIDISESKKMEMLLREDEEKLRLAAESAGIGIHWTDFETGRIHWSPVLYEIAGLQCDTVTTRDQAWNIVHPEDLARVKQEHKQGLDPASGGNFYSEHRIVRPSGEVRWVLWRGRTFFRVTPAGPIPYRRIGICMDISERKRMEIALRESEKKFSLIFNASPLAMAISTFDEGRYLAVNPAECLLTGYRNDELIGRDIADLDFFVNPEDGRELRRMLAESGQIENFRFRFKKRSGDVRWGFASACLIEFGGRKCLLTACSDITSMYEAEQALKLSEKRLRMAAEGANLGLYDWDIQSGAIACNEICYTMLGYTPQEFLYSLEMVKNLIHPEDLPDATESIQTALSGNNDVFSLEYRVLQKDGNYRWIRDAGRVITRDKEGQALRAVGVQIDIHEKKLVEKFLLQARDNLDKRVKRRNASLEKSFEKLKQEIANRRAIEKELQARTEELAELNSALKVLLQKSRNECLEVEQKLCGEFRDTLMPILGKLKATELTGRAAAQVKLLEEALTGLLFSGMGSLVDLKRRLSPSEVQVVSFILQGKRTKQIAEVLSLSPRTIESHRKQIRRKLGLQNRKTNLRTYLSSVAS